MSNIICPSCNATSPAGAVFCDNCGYDLRTVTPAAPAPTPPTVATSSSGDMYCDSCGHRNVAGSAFCENCGVKLSAPPAPQPPPVQAPPPQAPEVPQYVPPVQQPYQPPPQEPPAQPPSTPSPVPPPYQPPVQPAPVMPPSGVPGRLVIKGSNVSLQIPSGKQEIIIGREDPVSGIFPDIDLDPHGGQDAGVGRNHAKITIQGNQVYIEDLNSVNGTLVNTQRIPSGHPHPINNGDEIRFGVMTLNYFSS